jgi:hypothetical protein
MNKLLRKKKSINKRKKISTKKRRTKKKRITIKNNNIKGGTECEIRGYIKKNNIPKVVSNHPKCQICHEKFKIPTEADNGEGDEAIYRTECCHLFHLNCLENYCKNGITRNNMGNTFFPNCPVCNADISSDCLSVEAFREKFLDTQGLDDYLMNIYENQSNQS